MNTRYQMRYYRIFGFDITLVYRPKWLADKLHEMFVAVDELDPNAESLITELESIIGWDPDLSKARVLLRFNKFSRLKK